MVYLPYILKPKQWNVANLRELSVEELREVLEYYKSIND
jgi:uncharacterized protein